MFTYQFKGGASKVATFVVGTKLDAASHGASLQTEATFFSEEIVAEIWITSAVTLSNTQELFRRFAEKAATAMFTDGIKVDIDDAQYGSWSNFHDHLWDDMLLGEGALVKYPDPVLLDTEEEMITDLQLYHQCVTMTGQSRTFTWETSPGER